ncbi:glucan phosphorylase [Microbacterium testaceum StLB037]|uniref:Glucan phosphorylase n=1 Tax=Microbacterium testaceum (strain StLB037) TaxID=979556 RepID=E8NE38_MICTS|nr:glycosyl hydrolase [Microbacterium testaceum]BAJ76292.1 glucan phosphorylase [Microbacterium testaceum StLB037]
MKSKGGFAVIGMALTGAVVAGVVALGTCVAFGGDRYAGASSVATLRLTNPSLLFASPHEVNLTVQNARGDLNWSVRDSSGDLVDSGTVAASMTDQIEPTLRDPGFYTFVVDDGRGPLKANFLVTGDVPKTADPFFSVATHWGKRTFASSTWPLASTMPLVTGLGIRNFRDETPWATVERTADSRATPDFATKLASAAQTNDMHMMLVAGYGNPHAYPGDTKSILSPPVTDQGRAAFVSYINTVIDSNPSIDKVEVWNEFNTPRRNTSDCQSGACYATLVKAVSQGVKAQHPNIKIVAGNTHGIPIAWFTDFANAGGLNYADMISVHGYAPDVTDLHNGLNRLDSVIQAHNNGQSKPIIVSEVGLTNTPVTPTIDKGSRVDNEDQAAGGLVQMFATLKSLPSVQQAVWYDAINDGTDPNEPEQNFGLFQQPTSDVVAFQPKAGAAAMVTTIRQLSGFHFTSVARLSGTVAAYTFTDDAGQVRRILWKTQPYASSDQSATPVTIKTAAGDQTTIYSATGKAERVMSAGSAIIQVGAVPIFLDEQVASH